MMLINCCIIIHNMVIEVRKDIFRFNNLAEAINEQGDSGDNSEHDIEDVWTMFPDDEIDLDQIPDMQQILRD